MADNTEAMRKALGEFVSTIDNTGGIRYGEDGVPYPVGDEDWVDIAVAYESACDVLGRQPKVDGHDDGDICHQCGQPFRIDDAGVANHLDGDGDVDHEADADHVPYKLPEDGTGGQDRESYSDDQDRENYTVDPKLED